MFKNIFLSFFSLFLAMQTSMSWAQNELPEGTLGMIVTPHNQVIDYKERTLCLNIKSTLPYEVECDQTWASVRKGSDGNVFIHVQQNYDIESRTAEVSFLNYQKNIRQKLIVTQGADGSAAEFPVDERIIPSSATDNSHANSGNDGGIANSYDDNLTTLYHTAYRPSKFEVSASNPAVLTYNFTNAERIDYLVYVPRVNGGNGTFGEFAVYVKSVGSNDYKLVGNYDNGHSASGCTVKFPDGILTPASIQIRVYDGVGGYASCAEMKFMKDDNVASAFEIFSDSLYTTLKEGVTLEDIENVPNQFVRTLAAKIFNKQYSTKYRVAEFPCLLNVTALADSWNVDGKAYDQLSGVTGISFAPGTHVVVCRMPEDRTATLKIVSWYNGKVGTNSDGGSPQIMTFTLRNGANIINYQPMSAGLKYIGDWTDEYNGLGYIIYDDAKAPEGVRPLKVHFINGVVNGYLSEDLTNEEMYEMTANAKNSHMDLLSKKVHAVWTSKGLHNYCKSTAGSLGYHQYMNVLDSLITWEHDLIGFTKYGRVPQNRTFSYVNYTYYMFQPLLGVSFHVNQESRVLNCNKLINEDNDLIWGLSHEWGHQHQMIPYFCWKGMTEVTNNLNSYYNILKMGYTKNNKIDKWPTARKHFISDNISDIGKYSSTRCLAYRNCDNFKSWNADYYNLAMEMKDSTIVRQSENIVKGLSIHEVDRTQSLCPFIMLTNYFTVVKGMKDFTPDMFEALRQTENENGSVIEKQGGLDKYEIIAMAQNNNKNNCVKSLAESYPNSVWAKYITASHCARTDNSMPFVLNYIRKVSMLSGYNLFPYFEKWGFLRQIAQRIDDYGYGWCVFPKAAYDEFKNDMDELVKSNVLKEMPDGMVEDISNTADRFMSKPYFPSK